MPLSLDPNYVAAVQQVYRTIPPGPDADLHDIALRRANVQSFTLPLWHTLPSHQDVLRRQHFCSSHDGSSIAIHQFYLKNEGPSAQDVEVPAILHCHGGGMISCSVEVFAKYVSLLVHETGVPIFSVEYRNAPEHPHPTPSQDCYAGLIWLFKNATRLGIDPGKIAVMGESAGGGMAASVALRVRDKKPDGVSLAKQILIYPMLDDRTSAGGKKNAELDKLASWTAIDNITGWSALLGKDRIGTPGISPYAAPARVESVEGLPPTYIDVGELDLFRDEDITYAARIAAANINLELHVYPGVPHGWEPYMMDDPITQGAMQNRVRAIKSLY